MTGTFMTGPAGSVLGGGLLMYSIGIRRFSCFSRMICQITHSGIARELTTSSSIHPDSFLEQIPYRSAFLGAVTNVLSIRSHVSRLYGEDQPSSSDGTIRGVQIKIDRQDRLYRHSAQVLRVQPDTDPLWLPDLTTEGMKPWRPLFGIPTCQCPTSNEGGERGALRHVFEYTNYTWSIASSNGNVEENSSTETIISCEPGNIGRSSSTKVNMSTFKEKDQRLGVHTVECCGPKTQILINVASTSVPGHRVVGVGLFGVGVPSKQAVGYQGGRFIKSPLCMSLSTAHHERILNPSSRVLQRPALLFLGHESKEAVRRRRSRDVGQRWRNGPVQVNFGAFNSETFSMFALLTDVAVIDVTSTAQLHTYPHCHTACALGFVGIFHTSASVFVPTGAGYKACHGAQVVGFLDIGARQWLRRRCVKGWAVFPPYSTGARQVWDSADNSSREWLITCHELTVISRPWSPSHQIIFKHFVAPPVADSITPPCPACALQVITSAKPLPDLCSIPMVCSSLIGRPYTSRP
ncbi:hypothetical protein BV25DRAFT_1841833 [Artomyces pyxidatus]|uniref:Uncharacterized protein n=1 Tax=Artomyces pyxidatus TaxID=48021 RepID=A0ACB8SKQ1_9AGAM|nr:hypothetical protein BV25DRAFT_1841833 [Artomyces pyxidatus]